jgi:F0F1-type ATP synthase assembly protein I
MRASRHPGQTLGTLVMGTIAVLAAIGLVLVSVPGSEPVVLVVGLLAGLALYAAMYVVRRRRHW